ncbi:hypothetical protein Tcan_11112 [Toxocara canis]|uniref:Uncharacterized protein n=1 Tax=Toxocara canis TaxID=6265 RepID=A0A0B2VQG0_TOXCA|nr:hypothetical protein Tcan_11112 [Toxocara canis]
MSEGSCFLPNFARRIYYTNSTCEKEQPRGKENTITDTRRTAMIQVTIFRTYDDDTDMRCGVHFRKVNTLERRRLLASFAGLQLGAATVVALTDKQLLKKPEWYQHAVLRLEKTLKQTSKYGYIQSEEILDEAYDVLLRTSLEEVFVNFNNFSSTGIPEPGLEETGIQIVPTAYF